MNKFIYEISDLQNKYNRRIFIRKKLYKRYIFRRKIQLFNLFRVKLRRALKSTSWAITVKRNRVKLRIMFKVKRGRNRKIQFNPQRCVISLGIIRLIYFLIISLFNLLYENK